MMPNHLRVMKTSRKMQFGVTALLLSAGCSLLLIGATAGFATMCFCMASIALYRRAEFSRPMPAREIWISVGVLAVLAAFIILANHFLPRSFGEHFARQPLVVASLWVAAMAALYWRWSRERRLTDAS